MKIVAICGLKGTGKDTVATIISDILNENDIPCRKLQFGDYAKHIICQAFELRDDREYNQFIRSVITLPNGRERTGKLIAKCIQAKLRQGNASQFIDKIEDAIIEYKGYHPDLYDHTVFLITDLRFKEELKWCKKNNVTILKVKREGGYYDPLADEIEIDDIFANAIIHNDGTEADLKKTILRELPGWL